jgi:tRNA threonylcarbamoyladenosine biosynthesis protein TsaE
MKTKIWEGIQLQHLPLVATEVVKWLKDAPDVWRFTGQMGAGKTTFIKSLCLALGVVDTVQSPTFSLVNQYLTATGEPVYHFDFYRIETPEEASRIGIEEYFDSGYKCLIEWPERVEPLLPQEIVQLTVLPQADTTRTIEVCIHGATH